GPPPFPGITTPRPCDGRTPGPPRPRAGGPTGAYRYCIVGSPVDGCKPTGAPCRRNDLETKRTRWHHGRVARPATVVPSLRKANSVALSERGVQETKVRGVRLCFWFRRQHVRTKNKVSCIGLVYTAPVHPSLKAVSLSTAGPEKVSSDGPLGDSCIGLVYTAPVHPSLKAVSLSTAGPEKVSSDGPLGD